MGYAKSSTGAKSTQQNPNPTMKFDSANRLKGPTNKKSSNSGQKKTK